MKTFNSIVNEIQEVNSIFKEKLEELNKELSNLMSEKIRPLFDKFFEENPNVKCLTWVQYTPHFNDGEQCVFTVYDINAFLSDDKVTYEYTNEKMDAKEVIYNYSYPSDEFVEVKSIYCEPSDTWTIKNREYLLLLSKFIRDNSNVLCNLGEGLVVVNPGSVEIHEFEHE